MSLPRDFVCATSRGARWFSIFTFHFSRFVFFSCCARSHEIQLDCRKQRRRRRGRRPLLCARSVEENLLWSQPDRVLQLSVRAKRRQLEHRKNRESIMQHFVEERNKHKTRAQQAILTLLCATNEKVFFSSFIGSFFYCTLWLSTLEKKNTATWSSHPLTNPLRCALICHVFFLFCVIPFRFCLMFNFIVRAGWKCRRWKAHI